MPEIHKDSDRAMVLGELWSGLVSKALKRTQRKRYWIWSEYTKRHALS